MNQFRLGLSLLLFVALTGCGGGGGGSSDGGSASGSSSSSGGSSSSSSGSSSSSSGSSGGTDSAPPEASIIFPWKVSRSDDDTLLVRGVASDANGIKSVRVNGVEAELTVVAATEPVVQAPNQAPPPVFAEGAEGTTADSGEEVTWEVSVPAQDGDSTVLVVETEDDQGNVDEAAGTAEILQKKVPTSFAIDSVNRRLIGQADHKSLVTYGLDDGGYHSVDLADANFCSGLGYRADQETAICATLIEGWLRISEIDLETGSASTFLVEKLTLDPEEWLFANLLKLEVTEDSASAFILAKYFSAVDYSLNKTVIWRYDFGAGELTTFVDGQVKNGDKVTTTTFTLSTNGLVVFNGDFGDVSAAYLIDFMGDALTPVSLVPDLLLYNLDTNADGSLLYSVGFDGIAVTDTTEQTSEVISLESEQDYFGIDQIRSVGLDAPNNRLLIGDDGFDYVLAVDTETGERSEFAANGVGDGKRLIWPRAFVLDEGETTAFLLDDGGNSDAALITVDLATGDRSIFAEFGDVCHYVASDVILDSKNALLYAVFENVVYKVNLVDGTHSVLAGDECGAAGFALTGAELDSANGRLLLTDTIVNGVMSIDLASGAVDVLVQSETELDTPVDLALDTVNGQLYIVSQAIGGLHKYDLEAAELTSPLDDCLESPINQILDPDYSTPQHVVLDSTGQYLWISGDRVGKYNLQSPTCQAEIGNRYSVLDVKLTKNGQLLGTESNQMIQLDFVTDKSVIISK